MRVYFSVPRYTASNKEFRSGGPARNFPCRFQG
jgi:hypothetical protein